MTLSLRSPGVVPMLLTILTGVAAGNADAQQRTLTIEEIYDAEQRVNFSGRSVTGLTWLNGTHYLLRDRDATGRTQLQSVEAETGVSEPLLDVAALEQALAGVPGMGAEETRRIARAGRFAWNPGHTALLMNISNDLYYYSLPASGDGRVRRLTRGPATESMPSFSPDGTMVAFVRDHDLLVVDVDQRREWALTRDGDADHLNGELDWVY